VIEVRPTPEDEERELKYLEECFADFGRFAVKHTPFLFPEEITAFETLGFPSALKGPGTSKLKPHAPELIPDAVFGATVMLAIDLERRRTAEMTKAGPKDLTALPPQFERFGVSALFAARCRWIHPTKAEAILAESTFDERQRCFLRDWMREKVHLTHFRQLSSRLGVKRAGMAPKMGVTGPWGRKCSA